MNASHPFVPVRQSCLPSDLKVAFAHLSPDSLPYLPNERRVAEHRAGRELISAMIRAWFGDGDFHIQLDSHGKPTGSYNNRPVELSISHCKSLVCGAISMDRPVGIDIERIDRNVTAGLQERILSPEEQVLCKDIPLIQLWSIKESALKWYGSGLRQAMNRVSIVNMDQDRFLIRLMDGRLATCCSFQLESHWMAVTFRSDLYLEPGI